MKDKNLNALGLAAGIFAIALSGEAASRINSIEFVGISDPNQIDIRADGPLVINKQMNEQDKQVILEIPEATIGTGATRKIDTSSFNSPVLLISPYQVQGQANTVRIVLQMRENADVDVTSGQTGAKVTVASAGSLPPPPADSNPPSPTAGLDAPVANTPAVNAASAAPAESKKAKPILLADPNEIPEAPDTATDTGNVNLRRFSKSQDTGIFTGRPVTLQVRDMNVGDVFQLISEASGFNIVLGPDVKGTVSLSLVEVPWDQALDVVLKSLNLSAERNRNILRVMATQTFITEKEQEYKLKEASAQAAPRLTQIFPINYADLADLKTVISSLLVIDPLEASRPVTSPLPGTPPSAVPTPSRQSSSTRSITADKRTNSLVVRDTADNIERIQKLIEILDVQNPQVLIEGKVVEASESFTKTLGGNLGFNGTGTADVFASFNGGNPVDTLLGAGGVFSGGTDFAGAATKAQGAAFGMSFIPGVKRLNAVLTMGESEDKLKLIASPRVVVQNQQSASIVQGTPVALLATTYQNGVPVTGTSIGSANLSLRVTPTVTNDGNVRLKLNLTRDIPATVANGTTTANRSIETDVVVESGTTLVLGGIYTMRTANNSTGLPLLRKLPLIGALFGSEGESTDRSELFFFITPQILNPKKAGLGT